MSIRARTVSTLLLAAIVVACTPGGATPAPAATSAERPPAPSASAAGVARTSPAPTLAPTPTPSSTPAPTPTTAPPAPSDGDTNGPEATPSEPFDMNLATRADFVAQYTFEWCVGASLQMALNMATDQERTSRKDQQALWEMARDRSFSPFGGANPIGWTAALNDLGIGPYRLVSLPTFEAAVETAAAAIRDTERPVGLVMWRGRHAWVMSGFEATADPAGGAEFDVTGIRVHDPLYPHGSAVWGKSPKPNSLVSPATLAKQFVIRDGGRVNLGVPAGWLLILPVADA